MTGKRQKLTVNAGVIARLRPRRRPPNRDAQPGDTLTLAAAAGLPAWTTVRSRSWPTSNCAADASDVRGRIGRTGTRRTRRFRTSRSCRRRQRPGSSGVRARLGDLNASPTRIPHTLQLGLRVRCSTATTATATTVNANVGPATRGPVGQRDSGQRLGGDAQPDFYAEAVAADLCSAPHADRQREHASVTGQRRDLDGGADALQPAGHRRRSTPR